MEVPDMSFFNRLMYAKDDGFTSRSPYGQRVRVAVDPEPDSERNVAGPGSLLQFMANSNTRDDADELQLPLIERDVAAQLPIDTTSIDEEGYMDSHRKPIVSIHGKDVEDHDERRKPAA
jgi:hypothetical protein